MTDIYRNVIQTDFRKATRTTRPLTKDMLVRKELGVEKGTDYFSPQFYTRHQHTPIIDVDFPSSRHDAHQVVHKNTKEFMEALRKFMKTKGGRESAFRLYRTPGGIRGFDISRQHRGIRPVEWEGPATELGTDPNFISMMNIVDSYNARIFPKAGRGGDYIARTLFPKHPIIKGDRAIISPESLKETMIHDELIRSMLNVPSKSIKGLLSRTNLSALDNL